MHLFAARRVGAVAAMRAVTCLLKPSCLALLICAPLYGDPVPVSFDSGGGFAAHGGIRISEDLLPGTHPYDAIYNGRPVLAPFTSPTSGTRYAEHPARAFVGPEFDIVYTRITGAGAFAFAPDGTSYSGIPFGTATFSAPGANLPVAAQTGTLPAPLNLLNLVTLPAGTTIYSDLAGMQLDVNSSADYWYDAGSNIEHRRYTGGTWTFFHEASPGNFAPLASYQDVVLTYQISWSTGALNVNWAGTSVPVAGIVLPASGSASSTGLLSTDAVLNNETTSPYTGLKGTFLQPLSLAFNPDQAGINLTNTTATGASFASVTSVGGGVVFANNSLLANIDLSGLTTASGTSFVVTDNPGLSELDLSALTNVSGADFTITDNASLSDLNLGELTHVSGGDFTVSGNSSLSTLVLSSLVNVSGGDFNVTDNAPGMVIDLSENLTVSGSVFIETDGGGSVIDIGGVSAGGDLNLTATTASGIVATTAAGSTSVTMVNAAASMTVDLPQGTFTQPVTFSIERLDPATLGPEPALDLENNTIIAQPIAAYQFDFAIPTLNAQAQLLFVIDVMSLSTEERAAFLAALAADQLTLGVKGDEGGPYNLLDICGPGDDPNLAGCVSIALFDADHLPMLSGGLDDPAYVHFTTPVSHFSTYALMSIPEPAAAGLLLLAAALLRRRAGVE